MQNHEKKLGIGKVALVAGGIAFLAGAAYADLRYFNGFVYVDTDSIINGPPYEDTHVMEVVRYPKQGVDSLTAGVQPTTGYYDLDAVFVNPKFRIGDTAVFRTLDLNALGESARVVVPIDSSLLIPGDTTLVHNFVMPSVIAQDTSRSNRTFCIDMVRVIDSSGTNGPVKYAYFGENTDSIFDNIPPYPKPAYDSVRADLQRLNRDIGHLEPIHLLFYKGELSDTTSAFTDTVVNILRQIGSFKNDAMRIPNITFPKTILAHDGGLEDILVPTGKVDSGKVVTPQSLVKNHGQVTSIIPVYFSISDSLGREIYRDSAETEKLAPESTQVVDFKNWTAVRGLDGDFILCQKYRTYTAGKDGKVEVVPETNLILPKSYVKSEVASGRAQILPAITSGSMIARSWTNIAGDINHGNDTAEVNLEVTGIHEYTQPQVPQHKRIQSPCSPATLASNLERIAQDGGKVEVIDVAGRKRMLGAYSDLPEGAYLLRTLYRAEHANKHAKHEEKVITDKVIVKR